MEACTPELCTLRRGLFVGVGPADAEERLDALFGVGDFGGGRDIRFFNGTHHFVALDFHSARGVNANADSVTAGIEHSNDNVITNQDLFS